MMPEATREHLPPSRALFGARRALERIGRGCAAPFLVLRAVLREPRLRPSYLRIVLTQVAVMVVVALVVAWARFDGDDDGGKHGVHVTRSVSSEPASSGSASAETPPPPAIPMPNLPAATPPEVRAKVERAIVDARKAAAEEAAKRHDRKPHANDDDSDDDEDDDAQAVIAKTPANVIPAAIPGSAFLNRYWRTTALFAAQLWAALLLSEWLVIALSRDFHDAITHEACLVTAVPPDGPRPPPPRVRLNFAWMRKKMKRKLRGLLLFVMGIPIIGAIAIGAELLVELLPGHHDAAGEWARRGTYGALSAVWGAYWVAVFIGAQTDYAWRDPDAPFPWYLRIWTRITARVPGFRWSGPRFYGRALARVSRSVLSPTAAFERHPFELVGLALARTLVAIPGVYLFVRPLLPVAAARIHLDLPPPASPETMSPPPSLPPS